MVDVILNVVTPATVVMAVVIGVALGTLFLPVFGRAIGAAEERRAWGAFVGVEVIGLVFLMATMVARIVDGSALWPAWLGTIALWTIMAVSAAVTTRLGGG